METAMKIMRLLGLAFFLCLSLSANGALISTDDAAFGVGSTTTDTESGLEWLDLTFSTGLSYDQITLQTVVGGTFEGFRLALVSDVRGLFDAAGLPTVTSDTNDFGAVNALIDLIGSTSSQGGFLESLGVTGSPGGPGSHLRAGLDFFIGNGQPLYRVNLGSGAQGDTAAFDSFGGWLVRDARPVSEPGAILLLLSGLLALVTVRTAAR